MELRLLASSVEWDGLPVSGLWLFYWTAVKTLASAFLVRIGARGIAAVLQAVTLVLVARDLGPSAFGIFGQAQSIGIIGAALFGFGFSARALRLSTESDPWPIISGMYLIRVFTSIIVAVAVIGLFILFGSDNIKVLLAVAFVLIADMTNELTQGVLSGLQKQRLASLLLVFHRLVPFIAVTLLPIPGVVLLGQLLIGCAVVTLLALIYPLAYWTQPAMRSMREGLGGYWLSAMAGPLIQFDTTIIRLVTNPTFVGYYSAASRVGAPLNLISSSLVNIVVPAMAKERDDESRRRTFLKVRRIILAVAVLIIIVSPVFAELIVHLLGEPYRPGWPIFVGILVGAAFSGVSQLYQAFFFAINRPHVAAVCVGLGTGIGLVVLGISASLWGILGLAIGPVVLQLSILLLFVFSFRRISHAWA